MKRLLIFFIPSVLMLVIYVCMFHFNVFADVGVPPTPGSMIVPGDKTTDIEMSNEVVIFDIKKGSEECVYEICNENWYAHITANFTMRNVSSQDIKMDVIYPYPSYGSYLDEYKLEEDTQSQNMVVSVNETLVDTESEVYKYSHQSLYGQDTQEEDLMALRFSVDFKADLETQIKVEYDTELVYEPKSMYGSFLYIMETGSHWKGKIGNGEIIFRFPTKIFEGIFDHYNSSFEMREKELVWEFSDLEPKGEDNLRVTFAPKLLEDWAARNSEIESITSDNKIGVLYISDNTELIPQNTYTQKNWGSLESSPIFLLQSDPPIEKKDYNGWFTEKDNDSVPSIFYEFDAVYKVSGMNIFTGVPYYTFNQIIGEEQILYTVVDRPKTIRLTFSDGTTQIVSLEDKPDTFQSFKFSEIETSSIKADVIETFGDYLFVEHYVGLARMNFDVGEKVREKEEIVSEETEDEIVEDGPDAISESKSWFEKYYKYILIAAAAGIVIVGGGVFIVIKLRKKVKGKKSLGVDGGKRDNNFVEEAEE